MMINNTLSMVPSLGQWPADPQTDVDVSKDRIWIDGCFDFSHHGTPRTAMPDYRLESHIHGN